MIARTWMRTAFALTLAFTAACAAWSQENPRTTPSAAATAADFDPRNSNVQKILRDAVTRQASLDTAQSGAQKPARDDAAEAAQSATPPPTDFSATLRSLRELGAAPSDSLSAPLAVKFRAPRRFDHMNCDYFDCVAVTADGEPLYTIPRENYYGAVDDQTSHDSWLRCPSGVDKCREISVGLPLQWSGVSIGTLEVPF